MRRGERYETEALQVRFWIPILDSHARRKYHGEYVVGQICSTARSKLTDLPCIRILQLAEQSKHLASDLRERLRGQLLDTR